MPTSRPIKARWLALSLLSGRWDDSAITDRLNRALPPELVDVEKLTARLRLRFDEDSAPPIEALVQFILNEPLLVDILKGSAIQGPLLDSPAMAPPPESLLTFPLPELTTWSDVAAWLGLSDKELVWFSDRRSQQAKATEPKLHHYTYHWIPKRSGSVRLIEAPKSRLKAIQRTIVEEILNKVPPHASAHGFTRGRSTRSYVEPHIGKDVVLRLDLKDFFHSVPTARIGALFRRLGYPPNVAWVLQGLCTTSTSPSIAGERFASLPWESQKRLVSKHLAQGAPTSAPLANLCAWRLDCRMVGLAKRFNLQYTRYADDMALSGSHRLARMADFIEALVGAIVIEEGFHLNHRKTRLRLASQRQKLGGIIINQKLNCRRSDWDQLKAILYNCAKHGPKSQNIEGHADFRAHLQGRIAYVSWLNPDRGQKLRGLWDRINWDE